MLYVVFTLSYIVFICPFLVLSFSFPYMCLLLVTIVVCCFHLQILVTNMMNRAVPSGNVQFSNSPPMILNPSVPSGGVPVAAGGQFHATGRHGPVDPQARVSAAASAVRFGPMIACPNCSWVITLSPQDMSLVGSGAHPSGPNVRDVQSDVRPRDVNVYRDLPTGVEPYDVNRTYSNNRNNRRGRPWRQAPYAPLDGSSSSWQPQRGMDYSWQGGRASGTVNSRYSPELNMYDRRERRSVSRHRSRGRNERRSPSRGRFGDQRSVSRPRDDRAYGSRRSMPRDAEHRDTYHTSHGHPRGPPR